MATYTLDNMPRGKCGRCRQPVEPQYLWCENCEALVVRHPSERLVWIDRVDLAD